MGHWLCRNWRHSLFLLAPICIAYGALLALEGVAISWIDRWLPVSTFEAATWSALFVTAAATWLRLCLLGLGVYLILSRVMRAAPSGWRFGHVWAVGSAAVALAVLVLELGQHHLQYGGSSFSSTTVRGILLLVIYAKILLVYPGARLLIGSAFLAGDPKTQSLAAAWRATTFFESCRLFFLLIVLMQVIETVFVNVISYLPFVAPFWFLPDELSRLRYFVGQGTRIVAESVGVLFYVAFFLMLSRSRIQDETA